MLEMTAFIAIALLVVREFVALEQATGSRCAARLVGLSAIPFLLAFIVLFAMRVVGYLTGDGAGGQ
jgi:hypothetical protein